MRSTNKHSQRHDEDHDAPERIWPHTIEEARKIASSHIARYEFARQFVAGKRVYDAACGVGYGSCLLGETASEVTGLEICPEAHAWACENFRRPNVRFLLADLLKPWPAQEQAEVIVSFETMEHLSDPRGFLGHVRDRLVSGGTLVLSVPNGPRDRARHRNSHHLQYFTDSELKESVGQFFPEASYFSQIYLKNAIHYMAKLVRLRRGRLIRNFRFVPGLSATAKNWVVVAQAP